MNPYEYLEKSSAQTAMSRSKISAPLRCISNEIKIGDRILHQGAGRLNNPDRSRLDELAKEVIHYDPNYSKETEKFLGKADFDTVVSIYVLNVLPIEIRQVAMKSVYDSLKTHGVGFFAVRSMTDIKNVKKPNWAEFEDGWLVSNKGKLNFQRGYDAKSFKDELSSLFRISVVKSAKNMIIAKALKL